MLRGPHFAVALKIYRPESFDGAPGRIKPRGWREHRMANPLGLLRIDADWLMTSSFPSGLYNLMCKY